MKILIIYNMSLTITYIQSVDTSFFSFLSKISILEVFVLNGS